ncbi:MAG: hypothetical protein V2I26_11780 [Halieaceae bacterium]|jgi:hypothetical protein|nr:hypothetical protein [Halieaceae bacterium]
MVFTNKHVIIAMIVAPVLAILAWVGVGQFAGETPQAPVAGKSYPLVEKSNCRYASGACDLENEDFRLRLTLTGVDSLAELVVRSAVPLDGVVLGIGLPEHEPEPTPMRATDGQGLEWHLVVGRIPGPQERIRVVAIADGSSYFAEASTAFLQPEEG